VLSDAHCHPADAARVFPGAEAERRRLGAACASSASTLEDFEFCERLSLEAASSGAAPILPCFAAHPQMPLRLPGSLADSLSALNALAEAGRLAAVGETGFDLFGADFRETEKAQDALFAEHLGAALRFGLPIVIHARRAMRKVFAHSRALAKCRAVVFHSWPGTAAEGEALLRRGVNAFFSFGASAVNGRRESMRCCAAFPLGRLLTETDAPYQPTRGGDFSSCADLPRILEAAASLRRAAGRDGSSAGELEEAVWGNFRAAFGLGGA